MEPVTFAIGGGTVALVGTVGKIVYNYGRDRKELNGTVERVKKMEVDLHDVREDVSYIRGTLDTIMKTQE